MSFKLYSEIIEEFNMMPTKKDRLEILRMYDGKRFRTFLEYCFNPNIVFDVNVPKYKPSDMPIGLHFLTIDGEVNKFYRFIVDHPKRTPGFGGKKQENIFTEILEGLYKDESELLIRMVKKDLRVPYLTTTLIQEAYPGINL
jgi:hypothetical protein